MSKCNLSIELLDQVDAFVGGQSVRGTVVVRTDADVQCKQLEVQTAWGTHGFGNITTGTGQTATLFEGQWVAGQTYRYDFELKTAAWPPTYHGHYLNVDHSVEARAHIPWSFDPKASQMILVSPGDVADVVSASVDAGASATAGTGLKIVGMVFFLIFFIVIVANPFAWIFAIPIGILVGIWWFIFRFLPRARLGEVNYRVETPRLAPGQELFAELLVRPKRNVRLNRVLWKISGAEVCVSGSGSNRKTRRNSIFETEIEAAGAITLPAEQETRIPLSIVLPDTTAYSLELSDNVLKWTTELRVDIPRWPDWKAHSDFLLVPPTAILVSEGKVPPLPTHPELAVPVSAVPVSAVSADHSIASQPASGALTFEETVRHIWAARGDEQQTQLLIDAVAEIPFEIQAVIERRLLYGNDDPAAYQNGYVVWAHYPDPELPLILYAPHHLGDEFEQAVRGVWTGRGRVSGYDRRHGRLKIHLDEPTMRENHAF